MNTIQITANGGSPKLLRVSFGGYDTGKVTPQQITRSLTSKAGKQYATGYRYWQLVARVKYSESGGHATLADIESWETATTLSLQDPLGASYFVVLANGGEIKQQQMVPVFDSAESFAYIPLRFEENP